MSDRKATIALDNESDLDIVDVLVAIEKQPTSEWILDLVIPLTCVLIRIFLRRLRALMVAKSCWEIMLLVKLMEYEPLALRCLIV